jgi:hypothetical protein
MSDEATVTRFQPSGEWAASCFSQACLRLASAFFAAALVVLTHAPVCVAQADRPGRFEHGFADYEPWELPSRATRADSDALNARWRALAAELKITTSGAAGTYEQRGATRSSYLRWAPGGGFVYLFVYENIIIIDFSYGKVEVTPSEVVFKVERELRNEDPGDRPRPTPRRWVAARWKWGDFFVPVARMRDFSDYAAGLGEYNDFNGPCCEFAPFFGKVGDGTAQSDGPERPEVPRKYARLMQRPIEATIKSVGRKRAVKDYGIDGSFHSTLLGDVTLTPVRIDARRRRGLKPGLLFRLVGAPLGQYLKITRVGRNHSDGVVIRRVNDAGRETCYGPDSFEDVVCPPVAVGARVTTSPL